MSNCIFCGIVQGQQSASIVHEDETCSAFMDIHPLGRGHVLIIPRQHATQITELAPETATHLFNLAERILRAQRALGWGVRGSHILLNDGPEANQMVPHVHIHVVPRKRPDAIGTLVRLALHLTGLFGRAEKRRILDEQASALRVELRKLSESAGP